jgi:hypothetical protein
MPTSETDHALQEPTTSSTLVPGNMKIAKSGLFTKFRQNGLRYISSSVSSFNTYLGKGPGKFVLVIFALPEMFSSHEPVPIKGMGLLRRHTEHWGARGFMSGLRMIPLGDGD